MTLWLPMIGVLPFNLYLGMTRMIIWNPAGE